MLGRAPRLLLDWKFFSVSIKVRTLSRRSESRSADQRVGRIKKTIAKISPAKPSTSATSMMVKPVVFWRKGGYLLGGAG